ncbi:MAG: hypothetical protein ABIJ09_23360 [Pseudomonadota bacterium]
MKFLAALSVLVTPSLALASGPFELFGFNPRGKAMAGSQTATADDYTATFYNPALLTRTQKLNFGAAIHIVYPNVSVQLEQELAEDSPYQPNLPSPEAGLMMGFDFPVGGALANRLAVGVGVYLPAFEISRVRIPDPAVPHYYLYENSPSRMEVMPGIAVRWFDWLSTGVGMRATGALMGPTNYRVDPVAGTVNRREFDTALKYVFAPVLGVSLGPFFGLRAGAVYRGSLAMPIDFPTHIEVDGLDLSTDIAFGAINIYSPHTASLGLAYTFLDDSLTISLDLQYIRWSDAPDPSVQFRIDAEGDDLDRLGIGDSLDLPGPGMKREVRPAFVDVFVPRVAVEYAPLDLLTVRLGYFYQPTHIPNQTSGSNYIDNNTHGLTTGVGVTFADPLQFFENPITIDAAAAVYVLAERRAIKENGNDPVGNWTAGGQILDLSIGIQYDY